MPGGMFRRAVAARAVRVAATGGPVLASGAGARVLRGRCGAGRSAADVARLLERLGGGFLKAGQLLGTRPDLVGDAAAAALGRLQDDVAPMPPSAAATVVRSALGTVPDGIAAALAAAPVAGGAIACVYRAEVDGRGVAVKVRRPGAAAAIAIDLAILRWLARTAAYLPPFRRVPLPGIVDELGVLLVRQADLRAEAAGLRRLRRALADLPGVVVPDTVPGLCGDGVITMDFVDGLDRSCAETLPPSVRREQTALLVRAVYRMLFVEGLAHLDLHQGNVYFRRDGSVALLDAGLVCALDERSRRAFTEFFAGMIRGDGDACAEVLVSTVRAEAGGTDLAGFRRRVRGLVVEAGGRAAGDFDLAGFCVRLFDLQRRHRLFADPRFVIPMTCLLTLEGAVRRNHPALDFQLEAAPYALEGLLRPAAAPD
ncbi:AarF/ABC1/UbiB kinase family protein [Actinomadura sp. WMMB 499]|uniref:ABC1 kinase family protein n=1 Tax=Actinomadura sp. WMMB 499 TaxID=1219491 RepID=UPI00124433F2|nr:AarF/UbiB family protein [Actinomadura sp. WMMB 499]QFG22923.1 AarF/ABC1/UbiB kinase family protein [Actinomadura sp. WMMB 499]